MPDQRSSPDQVLSCFLARSELFQTRRVSRNELAEIDSDRRLEAEGGLLELGDRDFGQATFQPDFAYVTSILDTNPQIHTVSKEQTGCHMSGKAGQSL